MTYANFIFPQFAAAVNAARSLTDLRETVQRELAAMDEQHRKNADLSNLPTYGGDEPRDTYLVWSWDADSLLVGESPSDWKIISREEWHAR